MSTLCVWAVPRAMGLPLMQPVHGHTGQGQESGCIQAWQGSDTAPDPSVLALTLARQG